MTSYVNLEPTGSHKQRPLREALDEQSHGVAQALQDRVIQPLSAVHRKLAELAEMLPAGERRRIQPLASALAQFETELRRLAGDSMTGNSSVSKAI
jgi:hypothetical protein